MVNRRFVFLHPSQLSSREVSRRIQQMREAVFVSNTLESPFAIRHRTAIAPDNRGAQDFHLLVNQNQPVHLIRNTDGLDILSRDASFGYRTSDSLRHIGPPILRILLRPPGSMGDNRGFLFRVEIRADRQTAFGINYGSLHRRTSQIAS